jgi:NAD(P)-dependent dehydrogenase (short-subunit alcohol dehydrogenase family)
MSELRCSAGKNVVVTGGAKGQGYSHVLAFAEAGYTTVKAVEERGVGCHQALRIAA